MLFALLVLFSAFLIEGIGTYVSVVGLSSLFAANPVIITLAIALDVGKVVAVSFLYKYWKKIGWLMKSYMSMAALVLMLITSSGAFGFLSGEFQKAIADTNTGSVMTAALTEEQGRLQKRKEEIDKQVAQLKDDNVGGRTRLMRTFGPEVKRINDRLAVIDAELPKLKVEAIKKNVEVGPIIYVAEAFHTTPEQAVKWVILLIIFVFDPLAISLLLAGNYLIELRKQEKKEEELQEKLDRYVPGNNETPDDITVVRASEAYAQPPVVVDLTIPDEPSTVPDFEDTVPAPDEPVEIIVEEPDHIELEDLVIQETPVVEQPIVEETQDVLVLKNDIPVLDMSPEPVEAEPVVEEAPHEVITLEQITKPIVKTEEAPVEETPVEEAPKENLPLHRSILEDVNAKFGDIETDETDRSRQLAPMLKRYANDDAPIMVGGPSDRVIR